MSFGSLPLPYYLSVWFCKNKPMMLCLVWCGKKIEVLVSTPKTSLYPKNIIYHLIPVWNQKKDVWEGMSWSRALKWDPYWAHAASKRMNSGFLHSTWNKKNSLPMNRGFFQKHHFWRVPDCSRVSLEVNPQLFVASPPPRRDTPWPAHGLRGRPRSRPVLPPGVMVLRQWCTHFQHWNVMECVFSDSVWGKHIFF